MCIRDRPGDKKPRSPTETYKTFTSETTVESDETVRMVGGKIVKTTVVHPIKPAGKPSQPDEKDKPRKPDDKPQRPSDKYRGPEDYFLEPSDISKKPDGTSMHPAGKPTKPSEWHHPEDTDEPSRDLSLIHI